MKTTSCILKRILTILLVFGMISQAMPLSVYAEEAAETASANIASYPSETLGDIEPPDITAEGAILMDADEGVILYRKNMDQPYFPASITKIMTCLLAVENCSLNETVKFSNNAVFGIDRTSSNVGLDVGQSIPMEEAILCVMLASANEAATAIAEHVSGSVEDFTDLMNQRADRKSTRLNSSH